VNMPAPLAKYAVTEQASKGRRFAEKRHPYRSDFERDRDRIIHCSAFRRLEGKTQVFSPGLDDYYRSRLTHTIEVAQIGRTIARALGLNEVLTEAICLAHDLGHPPFGHSGEGALNKIMAGFGGFEHNRQSLRIVDLLEHPYPDFRGLNLMYETRLGLARHRSPYDKPGADEFAEENCSLEGQAANIADRIAYNCHDLEDGLRARLIDRAGLRNSRIFCRAESRIDAEAIEDMTIRRTRTAKTIIDELVGDCIRASRAKLARRRIRSAAAACEISDGLIVLSPRVDAELAELESFLLEHFYHHRHLVRINREVIAWLAKLFARICRRPALMPGYFRSFIPEHGLQRAVCDYVAGMTDRFCLRMLRA